MSSEKKSNRHDSHLPITAKDSTHCHVGSEDTTRENASPAKCESAGECANNNTGTDVKSMPTEDRETAMDTDVQVDPVSRDGRETDPSSNSEAGEPAAATSLKSPQGEEESAKRDLKKPKPKIHPFFGMHHTFKQLLCFVVCQM